MYTRHLSEPSVTGPSTHPWKMPRGERGKGGWAGWWISGIPVPGLTPASDLPAWLTWEAFFMSGRGTVNLRIKRLALSHVQGFWPPVGLRPRCWGARTVMSCGSYGSRPASWYRCWIYEVLNSRSAAVNHFAFLGYSECSHQSCANKKNTTSTTCFNAVKKIKSQCRCFIMYIKEKWKC